MAMALKILKVLTATAEEACDTVSLVTLSQANGQVTHQQLPVFGK